MNQQSPLRNSSGMDGVGELFRSGEGMAAADNYNDWVFALFAPLIRGSVLEVGCGVGTFSHRIMRSGLSKSLFAIDSSAPAIRHCRAHFDASNADFECLDIGAVHGLYDLIVCMNVLEHVADDHKFLQELLQLLRPGGSLFLLVPAHRRLYSDFDRAAGHFRRYGKNSILALLADAPTRERLLVTQRYFNAIGALGYFGVYRVLGRKGSDQASRQIGFFDRLVVPVVRRIEPSWIPFGLSLITTLTRSADKIAPMSLPSR